jgi:hypothetical protein
MACLCQDFEWPKTMLKFEHHLLCPYDFTGPGQFSAVPILIDSLFPNQEETTCGPTINGIPLVALSLGGIVKEGDPSDIIATSDRAAANFFWLAFCRYALRMTSGQLNGFTLIWREKPMMNVWVDRQVDADQYTVNQRFVIWARLAILRKC